MKIAGIQIRRRVFVGAGLMVAVTGAWLYWSRSSLPGTAPNPAGKPESFVKIAGGGEGGSDTVLTERAEYFDPTPLFLPTDKNYQQGELPDRVVRQPGQVFHDFQPKFNFAESELPDYGELSDAIPSSLPEVLARGNDAPFAGFGTRDPANQPLARRGGYLEVKALKTGVLSISEILENADLPPVDFMPAEFILLVSNAGLIGDPVITASSGKDEVDGKMKDYLINVFRIGERLAPGRYSVVIGP
jgi:hypothetical protein